MYSSITNKEREYIKIQNDLKSQIITKNTVDVSKIKSVAGVDLAYWKNGDKEYAVCCIVVLDYHTHEVIEQKEYMDTVKVPYIPGFYWKNRQLVLQKVIIRLGIQIL